jgi:hypothetical protein
MYLQVLRHKWRRWRKRERDEYEYMTREDSAFTVMESSELSRD